MSKRKICAAYLSAVGILMLSAVLGIFLGATWLSPWELIEAIVGGDYGSSEARIFLYVRLPRVLAALICGGALSLSGAVIQGVLSNKLASPSIIGVSSGAGLAVTVCSALGIVGFSASVFAFIGAFLVVFIISICARRWSASRGTVILAGVAMSSLLGAVSDTVITLVPDVSIMSNDFRIGDFAGVTYGVIVPAAVMIAAATVALMTLRGELDVLSLGEERASGLGLNVGAMRTVLLLLSAVLAGAAVSVCGLLSFVGLLVPHAVRRVTGGGARHLLPLCALFGAGFVALCDTAARVLFAPYEIPVGIIMAFLGAPFFIFILVRGREVERDA